MPDILLTRGVSFKLQSRINGKNVLTVKYHADWSYPTEVRFGVGRINELPEVSNKLKISRPLLITDDIIRKLPFAQKIQENLKSFGVLSSIFSDVQTNPNDTHLANALEVCTDGIDLKSYRIQFRFESNEISE